MYNGTVRIEMKWLDGGGRGTGFFFLPYDGSPKFLVSNKHVLNRTAVTEINIIVHECVLAGKRFPEILSKNFARNRVNVLLASLSGSQ